MGLWEYVTSYSKIVLINVSFKTLCHFKKAYNYIKFVVFSLLKTLVKMRYMTTEFYIINHTKNKIFLKR